MAASAPPRNVRLRGALGAPAGSAELRPRVGYVAQAPSVQLGLFFLVAAAIKATAALMIFARNPVGALIGILTAMLSGTLALFDPRQSRLVDHRDGARHAGDLQPLGVRPQEIGGAAGLNRAQPVAASATQRKPMLPVEESGSFD
jgi:hypothetical protein